MRVITVRDAPTETQVEVGNGTQSSLQGSVAEIPDDSASKGYLKVNISDGNGGWILFESPTPGTVLTTSFTDTVEWVFPPPLQACAEVCPIGSLDSTAAILGAPPVGSQGNLLLSPVRVLSKTAPLSYMNCLVTNIGVGVGGFSLAIYNGAGVLLASTAVYTPVGTGVIQRVLAFGLGLVLQPDVTYYLGIFSNRQGTTFARTLGLANAPPLGGAAVNGILANASPVSLATGDASRYWVSAYGN